MHECNTVVLLQIVRFVGCLFGFVWQCNPSAVASVFPLRWTHACPGPDDGFSLCLVCSVDPDCISMTRFRNVIRIYVFLSTEGNACLSFDGGGGCWVRLCCVGSQTVNVRFQCVFAFVCPFKTRLTFTFVLLSIMDSHILIDARMDQTCLFWWWYGGFVFVWICVTSVWLFWSQSACIWPMRSTNIRQGVCVLWRQSNQDWVSQSAPYVVNFIDSIIEQRGSCIQIEH